MGGLPRIRRRFDTAIRHGDSTPRMSDSNRNCRDYLRMLLHTGFHKTTHPPFFWQDVRYLPHHCSREQATATWALVASPTPFDFTRYADQHALLAALTVDIARFDPLGDASFTL